MQRPTQTKTLKSPVYKALSRFFLLFALFYIRKDIPCRYVSVPLSHSSLSVAGSLPFSRPLWLAVRQVPGSIFAGGENLHPAPDGGYLTAAILPCPAASPPAGKLMRTSAPRWRLAIVRAEPPPLGGGGRKACRAFPPAPPAAPKS